MSEIHAKQILLIEDNRDDIELIQIALKGIVKNELIKVIHDGEKAVRFLSELDKEDKLISCNDLGLIILDLQIPLVDGLALLKIIRRNKKTSNIPVVIFSSSSEEKDIFNSYRFGANSFIRKPVDALNFRKVVRRMTEYWLLFNKIDCIVHD